MRVQPSVLVADDNALVCWAARRALGAAGFHVVEARTRREVLASLVSQTFQLVILSPDLATENVEDVAVAVAASAGATALIVLTENGVLPWALPPSGSVRAIDKPFSIGSLVDVARDLVPAAAHPLDEPASL